MGDSYAYNWKSNDSPGLQIAGKIMITVMILLFFIIALVLFLQLYFKCFLCYLQYNNQEAITAHQRRRRLGLAVGHHDSRATGCSLDPSVLNSIPIVTISSKDEEMECAVCLLETVDGEKVRILPKCNHGFHVGCIDMWFQSNSTCPICRNLVSSEPEPISEAEENSAVFPTNVLVCGNQDEVTSLSFISGEPSSSSSSSSSSLPSSIRPNEMVVIEMPRQIDEDEETKSPVIRKLKSFKRLLSMGTTRVGRSPSSSSDPGKTGLEQC